MCLLRKEMGENLPWDKRERVRINTPGASDLMPDYSRKKLHARHEQERGRNSPMRLQRLDKYQMDVLLLSSSAR